MQTRVEAEPTRVGFLDPLSGRQMVTVLRDKNMIFKNTGRGRAVEGEGLVESLLLGSSRQDPEMSLGSSKWKKKTAM